MSQAMSKNKPYNVRTRYSYKNVSHDMELHGDLRKELIKTGELLEAIRGAALAFKSLTPSYNVLREHECFNAELADAVERYKVTENE